MAHALACRVETRLDTWTAVFKPSRHRNESRRGTQECVRYIALAAIFLFLAACGRTPDLPVLGEIPAFQLTDQTGATFASAQQLQGRVWVADFFFTNCPGPCPRMGSQMREVQKAFEGTGLRIASMTVDPDRDTPQALAEYAKRFTATPGVWYFLTGAQSDLNHLAKNVFKLGTVDGSFEHSTRFVLVDRKSRVRGYYLTSEPDAIPRLIADAKGLLAEKT